MKRFLIIIISSILFFGTSYAAVTKKQPEKKKEKKAAPPRIKKKIGISLEGWVNNDSPLGETPMKAWLSVDYFIFSKFNIRFTTTFKDNILKARYFLVYNIIDIYAGIGYIFNMNMNYKNYDNKLIVEAGIDYVFDNGLNLGFYIQTLGKGSDGQILTIPSIYIGWRFW